MTFALVFSGQGSQHPQMLSWLADDDALMRETSAMLGRPDWRASLHDRGWARRNANAQLLLTGTALAAWSQLSPHLPVPIAIAGYSVGEVAAYCAAGVFGARTALHLAFARARAMDQAAAIAPGSLMGVSGIGREALAHVCEGHHLDVAIRNGCHSVVVAGAVQSLESAESVLTAQGARCTRLAVDVRSHTPAMLPAAERFARILVGEKFERPRTALISDSTGQLCIGTEQARAALAAQVCGAVQWSDCMDSLRARQPTCVLEIGPGNALARMWNERYEHTPARSCDEFHSVGAIARWVGTHSV